MADKMGAFFVGTSPTGNTFDADSWDAKVQAAKKDGWTTDIELSSDGDSYYQFTADNPCSKQQIIKGFQLLCNDQPTLHRVKRNTIQLWIF